MLLTKTTIAKNDLQFSASPGTIEDVQNWSHTEVWGGSSGVGPNQGVSINSSHKNYWRVRIAWGDGSKSSIDVPGHVKVSVGDKVAFVDVENKTLGKNQWVGMINHTLNTWFDFGKLPLLKPNGNLLNRLGMYRAKNGVGAASDFKIFALFSLPITITIFTYLVATISNFFDNFSFSEVFFSLPSYIYYSFVYSDPFHNIHWGVIGGFAFNLWIYLQSRKRATSLAAEYEKALQEVVEHALAKVPA